MISLDKTQTLESAKDAAELLAQDISLTGEYAVEAYALIEGCCGVGMGILTAILSVNSVETAKAYFVPSAMSEGNSEVLISRLLTLEEGQKITLAVKQLSGEQINVLEGHVKLVILT